MGVRENDQSYIAHTYGRSPLVAAFGKSATCVGENQKEYIDFSSGIGVNSLGFCNSAWVEAICAQAHTLQHISNLYYTAPMTDLAKLLCERTFAKKVFFANSGAEANEGMMKAARKYSSDRYGSNRYTILSLENSFHGRTLATLSATGQAVFHQHFGPFVEGFRFTTPNDIEALHAAIDDGVCAIMLELIQGEGGVVPLEPSYVSAVAEICAQRDILLLIDEVQTGAGRTGAFLCSELYGVTPDITSMAKGLGGGLPIGAVLLGEKCENTLGAGDHGTTFGGNPIACAGAFVVMKTINEKLLESVTQKGKYITQRLLEYPQIKSIEGRGLMLGLTLDGLDSKAVAAACLEQGLIVLTAKAKLRLLPPLTISYPEIDDGLTILSEVLKTL